MGRINFSNYAREAVSALQNMLCATDAAVKG